ncbi:MAG TPA: hypothetical protein VFQ95_02675 [Rhodanobacteraceae bacterium]|nr:hypothetical protein [Rhodanobacteraceae bacterium]
MNRKPISLAALGGTLALAFALAPAASAADYSLANGAVKFSAPDSWPMLMEKLDGQRQFVALQVRDPGRTDALARITVTVEQVDGVAGFQKFLAASTERAHKLQGYTADRTPGTASAMRYTATENRVVNAYSESYSYRNNLALQIRCIRPVSAPPDWIATFDAGCQSVVKAIEH